MKFFYLRKIGWRLYRHSRKNDNLFLKENSLLHLIWSVSRMLTHSATNRDKIRYNVRAHIIYISTAPVFSLKILLATHGTSLFRRAWEQSFRKFYDNLAGVSLCGHTSLRRHRCCGTVVSILKLAVIHRWSADLRSIPFS